MARYHFNQFIKTRLNFWADPDRIGLCNWVALHLSQHPLSCQEVGQAPYTPSLLCAASSLSERLRWLDHKPAHVSSPETLSSCGHPECSCPVGRVAIPLCHLLLELLVQCLPARVWQRRQWVVSHSHGGVWVPLIKRREKVEEESAIVSRVVSVVTKVKSRPPTYSTLVASPRSFDAIVPKFIVIKQKGLFIDPVACFHGCLQPCRAIDS